MRTFAHLQSKSYENIYKNYTHICTSHTTRYAQYRLLSYKCVYIQHSPHIHIYVYIENIQFWYTTSLPSSGATPAVFIPLASRLHIYMYIMTHAVLACARQISTAWCELLSSRICGGLMLRRERNAYTYKSSWQYRTILGIFFFSYIYLIYLHNAVRSR